MTIEIKTHKVLFSKGKLYLDDKQIAGEGITPDKDIVFTFQVKSEIKEVEKKEELAFSPFLSVNVHDSIKGRDLGPGQR